MKTAKKKVAKKFADAREAPHHHRIDRKADLIAHQAPTGDSDSLMDTPTAASWLGVSTQWLEIGRCKGFGPPFIKLAPRRVRYRKSDVIRWLESRTHASTAEYAGGVT